jgi:hypothetical protein
VAQDQEGLLTLLAAQAVKELMDRAFLAEAVKPGIVPEGEGAELVRRASIP